MSFSPSGDFLSCDFIRTERLEQLAPDVLAKLTIARQTQQPHRAFIDVQPSFDGLFATHAVQLGMRRLDLLGWLGNVRFGQEDQLLACPQIDAYRRFEALGLSGRCYITIHNGWDNVAHRSTENATKGWPVSHYEEFVAGFKERFPQTLVVQLGAKTSRPIAGTDISLLDDTTLHEAAWILKHSLLHVDGDSGLVHLNRALHTKSLVLFGPTNHEFFSYAQNETLFSTVCGNCWWSTHDWMRSCPRGLSEPVCMKSIEPKVVVDAAERHLRSLPRRQAKVEELQSWQPALPAIVAHDDRSLEAAFEQWRGRFMQELFKSAEVDLAAPRVAILDNAGLSASLLSAKELKIRTFSFFADREIAAQNAITGKQGLDFGSLYNIPEENNAFDVVLMPLINDQVRFPYAAIKESLRIVRENGLVVLTYRYATHSESMIRALEDLGSDEGLILSSAGGIVLRKTINGRMFAERNARANQRISV